MLLHNLGFLQKCLRAKQVAHGHAMPDKIKTHFHHI